MKILHIFVSRIGHSGGIETLIRWIAFQSTHSVDFLLLGDGGSDHGLLESRRTLLSFRPGARTGNRVRLTLRRLRGYDIIHTHSLRADIAGFLFMRAGFARRNQRWIVHCHGWLESDFLNWLQAQIGLWICRYADVRIVVSADMERRLLRRGIPRTGTLILENYFVGSVVRRSRVCGDRVRVIGVGRLSPEKRWDKFIDSAILCRERAMGCDFHLYGDGPEKRKLKQRLGSGLVTFEGYVLDKSRIYSSADILVICSDSEGTPFVLLEALSRGIPVIASKVGGIPNLVRDDVNGVLLEECSASSIVAAIQRLKWDLSYYRSISNGAIKTAEKLNETSPTHRLDLIYESSKETTIVRRE